MENITTRAILNNTTSASLINESEYHTLKEGTDFLATYYIWIIFAFGFPGNLLSFFIILRMSRLGLTTSLFYVALLAVVDNIAIVLKIIENQIRNNNVSMPTESCGSLFFLGLTFAAYPNWILIIMSAERFTAVRFPMKVGLLWSLKKAVVIISGVLVFLCLIHIHVFFTGYSNEESRCDTKPDFVSFYKNWFFISTTIYAFIPAVSLTIFNVSIIVFLRKSSKQRQNIISQSAPASDDIRHQDRQVTVMLVTLAIVFITLTIPRCIYMLVCIYWDPSDEIGKMRRNFIDHLTSNIADSNHAVNFYLYFVSGRKFRNYFLQVFRCEKK